MLQLTALGTIIERHKVSRLTKEAGLISKQPGQKRYKQAKSEHDLAPTRLNRQFVEAPKRACCGDITDIWTGDQWGDLAVVVDLYARRVVGWAMSKRPDTDLTLKARIWPGGCEASQKA